VEKDFPRAAWVVENARDQLSEPVELHPVSGVPHEKMPVYMNAADVLLMTSKWEGSPNSVREALACNLPVVATDVGDVSEHIGALPLSQVCQTDDELVGALVTALESQRTPRGREQARDLGLEQMGEDLLDVYHDALSR
jgi:glycosyltransferase involved in cell wall biosynthesis